MAGTMELVVHQKVTLAAGGNVGVAILGSSATGLTSGAIPNNWHGVITALSVAPVNGKLGVVDADSDDLIEALEEGTIKLSVAGQPVFEGPLSTCPAGGPVLDGMPAAAATVCAGSVRNGQGARYLQPPQAVFSKEVIAGTISTPALTGAQAVYVRVHIKVNKSTQAREAAQ